MKREFEQHIRNLIIKEDNFIYKTNLELLRLYFNYLWSTFKIDELCFLYLERFNSISDITSSKIESYFSELIIEFQLDFFDLSELEDLEGSGLYFIYNDIDNLIYIGKTNNLSSRPLQSFINKLPYGAKYIKILNKESSLIDTFEAVLIDYHLPMYNNKKELLPNINNRTYTKIVELSKVHLKEVKPIHPMISE